MALRRRRGGGEATSGAGHLCAPELETSRRAERICVNDLFAQRLAHTAVDGVGLVDDGVRNRGVQGVDLGTHVRYGTA